MNATKQYWSVWQFTKCIRLTKLIFGLLGTKKDKEHNIMFDRIEVVNYVSYNLEILKYSS